MASISPVSAIDLDILLIIQQAMSMPDIPIEYRTVTVGPPIRFERYIATTTVCEAKRKSSAGKPEILYF